MPLHAFKMYAEYGHKPMRFVSADHFIFRVELLPIGIKELVRTGKVAILREGMKK